MNLYFDINGVNCDKLLGFAIIMKCSIQYNKSNIVYSKKEKDFILSDIENAAEKSLLMWLSYSLSCLSCSLSVSSNLSLFQYRYECKHIK